MIKLHRVHKTFRTKEGEISAVSDVDLTIAEGEIFGIIGYSGAGKSTLVRLLNALEKPTSGTVHVAGKNLAALDEKALRKARREIGMIFQHFHLLWSRTVRENISFPLEIAGIPKEERRKRVEELIELVGLSGRGDSYPSQLSGGQKQRVGIARALANRPKVLLCDEATSALDPRTTNAILELLVKINQRFGLTIVMITHEMHVIRQICHRVAVMENGKIVEQGNVRNVFQQPQQNITKEFLKQLEEPVLSGAELKDWQEISGSGKLVKASFGQEEDASALLEQLYRNTRAAVRVLKSRLAEKQEGFLILLLDGAQHEVQKALALVKGNARKMEVIDGDRDAFSQRRLG